MLFWLVTIRYYAPLLCVGIWSKLRGTEVPQRYAHYIATCWGRGILKGVPGWHVAIEGRENLPPENTPYVLVANHESATDIIYISA